MIHDSSFVDNNVIIGNNTKVWHFTHIMKNSEIGDNCSIGQNVFIGEGVKIGNNVKIQNNVSLYSGVVCEDDVFLGPSCVFTNVINPSLINRRSEFKETLLKKGCSVGANATIICGNEIGEFSFVGAGSVVTKNIASFSLVVGNPAKHLYYVSKFGEKIDFDSNGFWYCDKMKINYRLFNHKVIIE